MGRDPAFKQDDGLHDGLLVAATPRTAQDHDAVPVTSMTRSSEPRLRDHRHAIAVASPFTSDAARRRPGGPGRSGRSSRRVGGDAARKHRQPGGHHALPIARHTVNDNGGDALVLSHHRQVVADDGRGNKPSHRRTRRPSAAPTMQGTSSLPPHAQARAGSSFTRIDRPVVMVERAAPFSASTMWPVCAPASLAMRLRSGCWKSRRRVRMGGSSSMAPARSMGVTPPQLT